MAIDFGVSSKPTIGNLELQQEVEEEVNALVGVASMKKYMSDIKAQAEYVQSGGNMTILHTSLHTVIAAFHFSLTQQLQCLEKGAVFLAGNHR
eukprot:SAG31_NODE_203_length_20490_cov_7.713256_2_plen_93_part_00